MNKNKMDFMQGWNIFQTLLNDMKFAYMSLGRLGTTFKWENKLNHTMR